MRKSLPFFPLVVLLFLLSGIGVGLFGQSPTCNPPAGAFAAEVTTRSANVSWNLVPGVFYYNVSYRKAVDVNWIDLEDRVFSPPHSFTGLTPDTDYDVRVRSFCVSSSSGWSEPVRFKTEQEFELCPPPVLTTVNNVEAGSATIIWTLPIQANTAVVSYRPTGRLNWTEIAGLTRAPYQLDNLRPNTTYEVRVQHICQKSISIFSNIVNFTTLDAPPCDTPIIRAENIQDRSVSIFWEPDFTNYEVFFRIRGVGQFLNASGNGQAPYTLQNLQPSTTYEVQMRQLCPTINSELSNLIIFTTLSEVPPCNPPTPSVANVLDVTAEVNWLPTNLDGYEIQYRVVGSTIWNTRNNSNAPPFVLTNLTPNSNYELRMRRTCNITFSEYTFPITFQTLPELNPCKTPVLQISGVTNTAAVITSTPTDARLRLEFRAGNSGFLFITDNGRSPQPFTGLAPGTRYEIRGQQVCATRNSAFSSIVEFTTLTEAPTCPGPTLSLVSSTNNSATLNWNIPTLEVEFGFKKNGETDFTTQRRTGPAPFTLTGLQNDATYEIRMRQVCGTEFSSFSNTVSVVTGNGGGGGGGTCAAPVISATDSSNTTLGITWAGTLSSPEFSIKGPNETSFRVIAVQGEKPFTYSGLNPNSVYSLRVRQNCSGTFSEFSNELVLKTTSDVVQGCITPVLTFLSTTDQSATISWTPNLAAFELQWREPDGAWLALQDQSSPPFTLLQLRTETNYEIRVRQNCNGSFSEFSNVLTVRTQATPPQGCPTPLLTANDVEFDRATMSWTTPSTTGQFELSFKRETDVLWTVVPQAVSSPFVINNLARGVDYMVRVREICTGGFSFYSNIVRFRTPLTPPPCTAPTLSASIITDDEATLSWFPTTQVYEVSLRRAGQTSWQVSFSANPSPWRLQGLTPLTTYEVRFRNSCSLGFTAYSNILTFTTLPLQPVCSVPQNVIAEDVSDAAALITWNVPNSVDRFEVYVSGNNGVTYQLVSTQTATTYLLGGLAPNTFYAIRIRSVCGNKFSQFSNSLGFSTKREASDCATPVNLNFSSLTDRTVNLNWSQRINVLNYDLQISTNGGQTWQSLSSITEPPFEMAGLLPLTNYSFRVRSRCNNGLTSEWSDAISFRTAPDPLACNTPDLTLSQLTPDAVNLNWTIAGSIFTIQFRTTTETTWGTNSRNALGSPFTLVGLQPRTDYEVRMRQNCADGRQSDWTSAQGFRTLALPPVCAAPAYKLDSVLTQSARTSWMPVGDTVEVSLRRAIAGDTSWAVVATNLRGGNYIFQNLTPATAYIARIRKICRTELSPYSNLLFFTTRSVDAGGCGVPVVQALNVTLTGATITWTPVMANYQFSYRVRGSGVWITNSNTQPAPIFMNNLVANEFYEVRMRKDCGDGSFSAWSNTVVFLTTSVQPNCPAPSAPQLVNLTNVTAQVNWAVSVNSQVYELSWSGNNGQSWITQGNLFQPPFTIPDLAPSREYLVRMRQMCNGQFSAFSATTRFTTFADETGCPTPTPLASSEITENTATITWPQASTGVVELSYRRISVTEWTAVPDAISGTRFVLTGLVGGTNYEVRARRNCGSLMTPFSLSHVFTTAPPVVVCESPVLSIGSTLQTAVQLTWTPLTGLFQVNYRETGQPNWILSPQVPQSSPFVLTGLVADRSYEVRIRQVCLTGQTSEFSNEVSFSTGATQACNRPNLTIGDLAPDAATFSWTPRGTGYEIRYRAGGSAGEWTTRMGSDTNAVRITELLPSTRYIAQVRNTCNGAFSEWTVEQVFFTLSAIPTSCSAPTLTLVSVESRRAMFNSQPSNIGLLYEWNYRSAGTSAWSVVYTMTPPPFTVFNLLPGRSYEVRLRFSCQDRFSPWSEVMTVQTPALRSDETTLSVEETAVSYSVYPNPTAGMFSVDGKSDVAVSLELVDLSGRRVYSSTLPANAEGRWSVSLPESIGSGVYILRLTSVDEGSRALRLMVQ